MDGPWPSCQRESSNVYQQWKSATYKQWITAAAVCEFSLAQIKSLVKRSCRVKSWGLDRMC